MRPLTEEELLTFLDVAKEDRLYAAYVLAATTGLRRGELLGLCWDCVDLEQGVITVKRQLQALKGGLVLEETTKSKSGRRSVVLTDDAIRELKAHRKRQLQEKLLLGWAYQDHNLVFCREDGRPLEPAWFTKHFERLLAKAGVPVVRLHDLRHTHASLLLARGVHPKIVQERLGHSSITMTLDLYSHLVPGLQEAAAATLNGLLSKQKGPARTQGQDK
jgi:integrase